MQKFSYSSNQGESEPHSGNSLRDVTLHLVLQEVTSSL